MRAGSYDETVRLWDVRNLAAPACQVETPCGGGVWRVAWHPQESRVLLAACMQNGFAVIRDGQVLQRYGAGAAQGGNLRRLARRAPGRNPAGFGSDAGQIMWSNYVVKLCGQIMWSNQGRSTDGISAITFWSRADQGRVF